MSNILTGFNMQGNDPIDNRIVSPSKFETLEEYLQRVPIQKRYYGLSFYALDENNELRHYTFQTSLIEPTIDDDEEEIERLDKELQEHVNNKEIHKTSEEIRSEIVDADIPDTIARVQWTLDQIDTAITDLINGASDEYNTLKKIQDKIVELRTEMESQLYGDDGGDVLKTLEQALKFLNQYKDFIVEIPDNYVNKQDIVDNLNTDDPTKVLSARQGKVLSETLTNYFDSAMASIRAETNRATNAENRIEAKLDSEIDRSTAEDIRIQSELDAEEARAQSEEQRIEDKLDAEIERSTTKDTELGNQIIAETNRAKGEEQRIETKLDNEITRSTAKDADHDSRIEALEGETHIQNTDIGTTSQTFQLQMGKPGNKIKNEDAAVSVRNATDTDYVNFIAKNATFKGNLIVEGQSFVTEAETVEIKDNILLLNKGEIGSGVTKGMAGLQIDRGTEPDFQILFVESDRRFKAGEEGNLQCLALRDDDGNMLDGMFTTWDSTTHRLKTTNIIPSTRKLFFNTNANSLGFANHTYDSSYSAESFIFTDTKGSLYFSAGESNLNLDTDKTYFRFYKNLMIPSSIISSRTSISLLNNSGATIATFGSPSTINSSLNVANQVIIKGGSDIKLIMQSADVDNFNLIESQNSSGTKLSTFGYYGTFWGINGYSIATESWSNNKFLPLAGGTMKNSIRFPAESGIIGNADGTGDTYILRSFNNRLDIGSAALSTRIISNASDLLHHRSDTSYKIWDAYNLTSPLNYAAGTAAAPNQAYLRNIGVNGTQWSFLSTINTATTSIYAPTTTGTSGQVLTSTGGVPTWSNISSIGDSRYVLKSGDTMTGALTISLSSVTPIILNNTNASATEISQTLRLGGKSKGYFGYTTSTGVFMQNATSSIICVKDNGAYYGTSANTLTKLLTSADLSSYATQSWCNSNFAPLDRFNSSTGYTTIKITGQEFNFNSTTSEVYMNYRTPAGATALTKITWKAGGGADSTALCEGSWGNLYMNNALVATQSWVNSQGFLKSVSGYLPLTGGTMSGSITIPGNSGTLVITANETSNYVRGISFTKGSTVNSAVFGYHSTGGDGTGSIVISPYPTSASPWTGNIGLFISKGSVKIDDVPLATQTWVSNQGFLKTTPSITISNSGSGNAVTAITANGHTLTVTKGATYLTSSSLSGYATQSWVTSQGYLTSSSLSGYATQTWVNNKNYAVRESDNVLISHSNEFNFTASSNTSIAINYRGGSGSNTSAAITEYRFYNGQGSYSNVNILANSFTGSLIGNASSATKLGSSTVGGTAKPIYLSSGTATACSATVGSSTVPVYMSAGTITQCSTTLGVSITGNAATATTATNSNNLGGYAAATYVKSTSTTKIQDIQVVTAEGSTTGVLYVVLES